MAKTSLLQQLISEREEIDAAIRVIQRVTSSQADRFANRRAAAALRYSRKSRNGSAPAPEAKAEVPRGKGLPKTSVYRTNRAVEAFPVPAELKDAIGNLEFPQLLALAVRAAGVAIPTAELVLLLENAGVKIPHGRTPPARYVGAIAGHLATKKILKKTENGWTKGARQQ